MTREINKIVCMSCENEQKKKLKMLKKIGLKLYIIYIPKVMYQYGVMKYRKKGEAVKEKHARKDECIASQSVCLLFLQSPRQKCHCRVVSSINLFS